MNPQRRILTERPEIQGRQPLEGNASRQREQQIRSFRDLDVYREAVLLCAGVLNQLLPLAQKRKFSKRSRLMPLAISVPTLIAESHGARFDDRAKSLSALSTAIRSCNRIICYCDLMREAFVSTEQEQALCNETLEKYFFIRLKLQNLQKSWKKSGDTQEKPLPKIQVRMRSESSGPQPREPRGFLGPRRTEGGGTGSPRR